MGDTKIYNHSGNVGNGPWSIPIVAVPVAILASIPYAYACLYNPCISVVSFILPVAFGGLLGWIVARAAKAAKCRNTMCVLGIGFLIGLLAEYTSWVVFLYALWNRFGSWPANYSIFTLYMSPEHVWQMMLQLNATGWYRTGHSSTNETGVILWVSWIGEFILVMGFCSFFPMYLMSGWVFCENCNVWCKEKDDLARFGDPVLPEHKARLKAGDLSVLAELQPYRGGQLPHIRLNNRRCESCSETETVQINRITYQVTNKGVNEKAEALTKHILLDAGALNALQNALTAQAAAKAAAVAPKLPKPPAA